MTSQESSSKINEALKNTLNEFLKFPLSEAIAGRRARRFCVELRFLMVFFHLDQDLDKAIHMK
jgi:hypothetical protein